MDLRLFFNKALKLETDWIIDDIEIDTEKDELHVYIKYNQIFGVCKATGEECNIFDYRTDRTWQHLNMFEYTTFIHCRIPRIKNSFGEVKSIKVPWSDDHELYTNKYENHAILFFNGNLNLFSHN